MHACMHMHASYQCSQYKDQPTTNQKTCAPRSAPLVALWPSGITMLSIHADDHWPSFLPLPLQVIDLSKNQEVTKQAEAKEREAQANAQAAALAKVGAAWAHAGLAACLPACFHDECGGCLGPPLMVCCLAVCTTINIQMCNKSSVSDLIMESFSHGIIFLMPLRLCAHTLLRLSAGHYRQS